MPTTLDLGALPARDLKLALGEAGVKTGGAVEKSELVRLVAANLTSLSVKALKQLLGAAGKSYQGVTEKADMVRLLRPSGRRSRDKDEDIVVTFGSKFVYMSEKLFEEALREQGIEDGVSHSCSRMESSKGEVLADHQWDDPPQQLFPLWCVFKNVNEVHPASPPPGHRTPRHSASPQPTEDLEALPVRELKRLLKAAGSSGVGATEKSELVRLLRRARAHSAQTTFEAGADWRLVPPGVGLPPGLEVRFDMATGQNFARLIPSSPGRSASPVSRTPRPPASPARLASQAKTASPVRPASQGRSKALGLGPLAIKDTSQGLPAATKDTARGRPGPLAIKDSSHGLFTKILEDSSGPQNVQKRVTGKGSAVLAKKTGAKKEVVKKGAKRKCPTRAMKKEVGKKGAKRKGPAKTTKRKVAQVMMKKPAGRR